MVVVEKALQEEMISETDVSDQCKGRKHTVTWATNFKIKLPRAYPRSVITESSGAIRLRLHWLDLLVFTSARTSI